MANDKEQWWTDNHSDEDSLSEAFADAAAEKVKQDAEIVRAGPHVDEEHRGEEPRAQAGQCRGQAEGGA